MEPPSLPPAIDHSVGNTRTWPTHPHDQGGCAVYGEPAQEECNDLPCPLRQFPNDSEHICSSAPPQLTGQLNHHLNLRFYHRAGSVLEKCQLHSRSSFFNPVYCSRDKILIDLGPSMYRMSKKLCVAG